jgi:hypothetical protein
MGRGYGHVIDGDPPAGGFHRARHSLLSNPAVLCVVDDVRVLFRIRDPATASVSRWHHCSVCRGRSQPRDHRDHGNPHAVMLSGLCQGSWLAIQCKTFCCSLHGSSHYCGRFSCVSDLVLNKNGGSVTLGGGDRQAAFLATLQSHERFHWLLPTARGVERLFAFGCPILVESWKSKHHRPVRFPPYGSGHDELAGYQR